MCFVLQVKSTLVYSLFCGLGDPVCLGSLHPAREALCANVFLAFSSPRTFSRCSRAYLCKEGLRPQIVMGHTPSSHGVGSVHILLPDTSLLASWLP